MLELVLERLAAAGIDRCLVVVGYRREVIEQRLRDWRPPIEFRVQDPVDGTGSAARLARDFAAAPFLLTFGDILCEPEAYVRCARVFAQHPDTAAVLGVADVDDPWRGAAVYADKNGLVSRVVEKPPRGSSTTRWNSAGLFGLRPLVFPYLDRLEPSPRGEYELTAVFNEMIAGGLEVRISPMEGRWRDVASQEDLAAANAELLPQPPDD
jgi:dTDP-glucose pyrophosphorylase